MLDACLLAGQLVGRLVGVTMTSKAGEMVRSVRPLVCKHEDMSLESQNPHKSQARLACVCNLSASEGKTGRFPRAHWLAILATTKSPEGHTHKTDETMLCWQEHTESLEIRLYLLNCMAEVSA